MTSWSRTPRAACHTESRYVGSALTLGMRSNAFRILKKVDKVIIHISECGLELLLPLRLCVPAHDGLLWVLDTIEALIELA